MWAGCMGWVWFRVPMLFPMYPEPPAAALLVAHHLLQTSPTTPHTWTHTLAPALLCTHIHTRMPCPPLPSTRFMDLARASSALSAKRGAAVGVARIARLAAGGTAPGSGQV